MFDATSDFWPSFVVVDIETTGLNFMTDRLHGIGIMEEGALPNYYLFDEIPDRVKKLLADPSVLKVGHNLHAFDAKFIRRAGLEIKGEFADTMVIWNLVDADSPLGLKFLTEREFGGEDLFRKAALDSYIAKTGVGNIAGLCAADLLNPSRPHKQIISDYCCEDVENTAHLYERGLERLKELDTKIKSWGYKKSPLDYFYEEALPLERVLFEIEYRGIKLDLDAIEKLKADASLKINENIALLNVQCVRPIGLVEDALYQKKINSLKTERGRSKIKREDPKLRFSWQNTGHVASLLFDHCGLGEHRQKTARGSDKLDKASIDALLKQPDISLKLKRVLALYLEYKKWLKLFSTYAGDESKGVLSRAVKMEDGSSRIFPSYRQTTGTGRLACSNPNMQNLPKESEVKRFFIPDSPGNVFDDADYSQIELRVAADETGDEAMCDAYINEARTGIDLHCITASAVFGVPLFTKAEAVDGSELGLLRQAGKGQNFLTIYKGGAWRLQQQLLGATGRLFSIDDCKLFIKKWFQRYPRVLEYLNRQKKTFEELQCVVASNGRMRRLADVRFLKGLEDTGFGGGFFWNFDSNLTKEILTRWKKANAKALHTPDAEELGRFAWKLYSHAIKSGYNQPIQGKAASLCKKSLIRLHNAGFIIANQVHDSIVCERSIGAPHLKTQLIEVMEAIDALRVPLKVDCKTLASFHPAHKAS